MSKKSLWKSVKNSFAKNKVVLKKSQHMREGKSLFERKQNKLDYWLRLLRLFSPKGSLTLVSIHMRFPMNTGPNRRREKSLGYVYVMFVSYYLHKFLKLCVLQTKKMSYKSDVLKISEYSQEKTCVGVSF